MHIVIVHMISAHCPVCGINNYNQHDENTYVMKYDATIVLQLVAFHNARIYMHHVHQII